MTATYNPTEIERLIAEAREDDARMTDAPWYGDSVAGVLFGDGNHADGSIELAHMDGEAKEFDPDAIARTRNNLRSVADQLEAAKAEIDRLRAECNDAADQDAEIYRLRAEIERMRPVFDASLAMRAADRGDAIRDEKLAARSCPTCGKPGCRPQEHAGWDPSKDLP